MEYVENVKTAIKAELDKMEFEYCAVLDTPENDRGNWEYDIIRQRKVLERALSELEDI